MTSLAALGALLGRLAADDERFRLFAPARPVVALPDDEAALLVAHGLAELRPGGVRATRRVGRVNGRAYLLELGLGEAEYRQEIWPETLALLDALAVAPPGRLLDLGTGAGILAIEAALAGHQVVATDLYENTLALAALNAHLHGVTLDLRLGHLFAPVEGQVFDLVLASPHYGRLADQLRVETLRAGPAHLAEGGRLVLATFFEWEGDGARLPFAETVLAPLAAAGWDVEARPLVSPLKRDWFSRAEGDAGLGRLVSRHRYVVRLARGAGRLAVAPPPEDAPVERFVPLARLTVGRAAGPAERGRAVVATPADAEVLEALLVGLACNLVRLSGAVPTGLLDACRFGARPCVSDEDESGRAGAILDLHGAVRPCTAGEPLAEVRHDLQQVLAHQRLYARFTAERRGCAGCPAFATCARCLFPGPLEEAHYCGLMIAAANERRHLPRLFALLERLPPFRAEVTVKLGPAPELIAAPLRPPDGVADPLDPILTDRVARLEARAPWLVRLDEDAFWLAYQAGGVERLEPIDALSAALVELALDGAGTAQLAACAALSGGPADAVLRFLSALPAE